VHRKAREIGERGVAGAEIVDAQPHAQVVQALQDARAFLEVLDAD
jgi:hypothetical protein